MIENKKYKTFICFAVLALILHVFYVLISVM